MQEGRGIYKFRNGDIYEGDYKNGERTGEGVFTFANGDVYKGSFLKGEQSGQGTFIWKKCGRLHWKLEKQQAQWLRPLQVEERRRI